MFAAYVSARSATVAGNRGNETPKGMWVILRIRIAHAVVMPFIVAAVTLSMGGCASETADTPARLTTSSAQATPSFSRFPPPVNEATLVPTPVSRLRPGVPIMVGAQGPTAVWCTAGFYIAYREANHLDRRRPAFITAAQCARGDGHAPVSVMRTEAGEQAPKPAKIGEMAYVTPGDEHPATAGEPWTIPTSPLAVFNSGRSDWAIPVDFMVNDKMPTMEIAKTAQAVEQRQAPATWTNSYGLVVTGHVLDRASTPELKNIPAGIERVVVAADDTTKPIDQWQLGSPVTIDVDGVTYNLGIITGTDDARRWVVVDLIGPFLTEQDAHVVTIG